MVVELKGGRQKRIFEVNPAVLLLSRLQLINMMQIN